ncbi:hypothetical protein DICPUDRAFT_91589 [Dictyostelium purpureum]|uniref:UBX domain-containing protein n=1 Tax=Dictyostelium purpureum TaxID=5786 RepID=F0ZEK5_DICPU|nr:uncharacterized protein DICPUDRAFT_91589 [Dictyostelium purpureum]EGC37661.1 hypothetical protein DICPUDRAFT_91589 [Dictyostelium purpureum]|eukprot:XP_003285849.1 hypothetical protein DICPUDRAFT_91589 [Dictyostelium purpureum]
MSANSSSNSSFVKCSSGNSISLKKSQLSTLNGSSSISRGALSSSSNSSLNNSFQLELKQHLKRKQESNQSNEKKEKFEQKKHKTPKPMDEPSPNASNSIKVTFQFSGTGKKVSRYFQSNCKVEVLKEYIEWLSLQEPQLFDSSFKLSDESFYRIIDYDFCYTIQPSKISISNFDITFKDSGFTPKSNLINISIV